MSRYTITIQASTIEDMRRILAALPEHPDSLPLRVTTPIPPDDPADAPPITTPIETTRWVPTGILVPPPPTAVVPPPPPRVVAVAPPPSPTSAAVVPPPPPTSGEVDDGERDSAGARWDAALHSATRSRTADGRWRARRGAATAATVSPPPPPVAVPAAGDVSWSQVVAALAARATYPVDRVREVLIAAGIDTTALPSRPDQYALAISTLDRDLPA